MVAGGGGGENRTVVSERQAVRTVPSEHGLHAFGVQRHKDNMGPLRLGCEGPHAVFEAPGARAAPPQGHVKAVLIHSLQPRLLK